MENLFQHDIFSNNTKVSWKNHFQTHIDFYIRLKELNSPPEDGLIYLDFFYDLTIYYFYNNKNTKNLINDINELVFNGFKQKNFPNSVRILYYEKFIYFAYVFGITEQDDTKIQRISNYLSNKKIENFKFDCKQQNEFYIGLFPMFYLLFFREIKEIEITTNIIKINQYRQIFLSKIQEATQIREFFENLENSNKNFKYNKRLKLVNYLNKNFDKVKKELSKSSNLSLLEYLKSISLT